nr:GIY-YIG nuclease family protein [Candidatus Levybacteria bacterium]
MWYVYILKSEVKKWYYVGSTNRLNDRVFEHNKGYVTSTKSYRPFKLVFNEKFDNESDARRYERKLKDKRLEKEQIINLIEKNS